MGCQQHFFSCHLLPCSYPLPPSSRQGSVVPRDGSLSFLVRELIDGRKCQVMTGGRRNNPFLRFSYLSGLLFVDFLADLCPSLSHSNSHWNDNYCSMVHSQANPVRRVIHRSSRELILRVYLGVRFTFDIRFSRVQTARDVEGAAECGTFTAKFLRGVVTLLQWCL